jgi:Hint domain
MHDATGVRRSRRNLIKIGAIAASAMLAKATPVDARPCAAALGCNCFLRGTTIRTADGDKKIEALAVGDLLPTVFGGTRPIQWISRYRFEKREPTKAWVNDVLPVRVARSALGPDVPYADLFVTKAHSLLIDDVLVPVCNLINGTTISVYDAHALDELEFFHISLDFSNAGGASGLRI